MLKTIYTIGKEISAGRDLWEDIIETKAEVQKEGFKYLVLNIIFDLDQNEIIISRDNLEEYDNSFERLKELVYLKTLGRRMKSPYLCVGSSKIENLFKTLFGTPDKKGVYPTKGDLEQAIERGFSSLYESEIVAVLKKMLVFEDAFVERFKNPKGKFTLEKVNESLEFSNKSKIVLVYPSVKSNELEFKNKPISSIEGYRTFLKKKYLESSSEGSMDKKLCYASGEEKEDVQEVSFSGRYNINKLFVQETKNYAAEFNGKDFSKNYQVSVEVQTYLDRGSNYILDNLVTPIADVRHVILPQFLNTKKDISKRLKDILAETDLLFNATKFKEFEANLNRKKDDSIYWLNFIAIDSDGNYFKAGNLIKDVSKFHFLELIKELRNSGELLSPWLSKKYIFNLNQMYRLVPVRKDKENINQALILFAAILESRKIDLKKLYKHFSQLILCHWYGRYRSFTNVSSYYKEFDFAAKDAVFGYLAFINTLRQLNLLKNVSPMENVSKENIAEEVHNFFNAMNYQSSQCALFYLGRALNQAAYAQQKKGNKKAVLEKLNYNGMDKRSIFRLSTDLFEKAKQYDIVEKMQWNLGEFNRRFDFNNWSMNPQEALFFILSGYTYGIKSSPDAELALETESK